MGILPETLFNFLLLLGWAPGGDRELITREEAAQLFDLSDVNKAPAVFDAEKLLWMNGQYMMRMTADQLEPHLRPFLPEDSPSLDALRSIVELNKPRARTLKDLALQMQPYLVEDTAVTYDDDAVKKHIKGDDVGARLSELHDALAATEPFDVTTTEQSLRALADSRGASAGKYIHPLRVALTGRLASPPIFDVAVTLGKEKTLRRIKQLIARLPEVIPSAEEREESGRGNAP